MLTSNRLVDYYLPPQEGFVLESLVATTYQVNFEFLEEDLLARALGVRTPVSRMRAFRAELERRLQQAQVTVLLDLAGCGRLARLSPRIDPIPISTRKLHAKVTVQLWTRPEPTADRPPERRLRLVVGSANVTRQGFRENYECAAAFDFGGRESAPRDLLLAALSMFRELSAEAASEQLARQLVQLEREAARLPDDSGRGNVSPRFVQGEEVVATLRESWTNLSDDPPDRAVIVSPFWPEGKTAANALTRLVRELGQPGGVEFVCRGRPSPDGRSWLPEFDPEVAQHFASEYSGHVYLRATLPDHGSSGATRSEDDETEDRELARTRAAATDTVQRSLHAKIIALSGKAGTVLYVGSANCTRRGLALGAAANIEAGLVYRLGPRQRGILDRLLAFAGPATEIVLDRPVAAVMPEREPPQPMPDFLSTVCVSGTRVTIRFRPGVAIPSDLRIVMEDPATRDPRSYWLLFRTTEAARGPNRF